MRVYFAESLETFMPTCSARGRRFLLGARLWVKFSTGCTTSCRAKLDACWLSRSSAAWWRRKILKALGLDSASSPRRCGADAVALLAVVSPARPARQRRLRHDREPGAVAPDGAGRNQEGTVGPVYEGVEARIDEQTGEIQMRSSALMLATTRSRR